jgi:hypothetical protein
MALSKVASDASVRPRSTARVMVAAKESGVRRRGKVWRSELWTWWNTGFDERLGKDDNDEGYASITIEYSGYQVITEANRAGTTTRVCWVRWQLSQSAEKPVSNGAGLWLCGEGYSLYTRTRQGLDTQKRMWETASGEATGIIVYIHKIVVL